MMIVFVAVVVVKIVIVAKQKISIKKIKKRKTLTIDCGCGHCCGTVNKIRIKKNLKKKKKNILLGLETHPCVSLIPAIIVVAVGSIIDCKKKLV